MERSIGAACKRVDWRRKEGNLCAAAGGEQLAGESMLVVVLGPLDPAEFEHESDEEPNAAIGCESVKSEWRPCGREAHHLGAV
jgi:hypothetical protein